MSPALILASSSRYRLELLSRLRLPFSVETSAVDEFALPGEPPAALAERLAAAKAAAIAHRFPDSWVIGSDQLAVCRGKITGKPGTPERCAQQLRDASGEAVSFLTAVCLLKNTGERHAHLDTTTVQFRALTDREIHRYIDQEQPFDCAGGFKVEGLGISLLERIDSQDPTALIGLPLIWVASALRKVGLLS